MLPVLNKLPLIVVTVGKLVGNAGMSIQIGGRLRETIAPKMRRSGNHSHLHIGRDAHGNHSLSHLRPKPDARVESLGNDIHEPALIHQFQTDIRVTLFEDSELWQQAFSMACWLALIRTVPDGVWR